MNILRYTADKFGLKALFRVCLTEREIPTITRADIPITLNKFIKVFGHFEHLLSPDLLHLGIHP